MEFGNERIIIELITQDHEDYVEFGDFKEEECQMCAIRGHEELFHMRFIYYGADILLCKSCINELHRLTNPLDILLKTGRDTKNT